MRTHLAALRSRSIYDVMAVIACVAAVGTGTAYAANTVFSTDIVDGEVKHADLAGNSVTSTNIYNGSVLAAEIADNAVGRGKVANNSLTTADVAGADVNGAISLDAGAVANGRCKSFGITVPGAKANEALVIATRAALPAGLLIHGQRVPADGHATMTVCNLSGSAMPALTDFPIRTVTYG